VSGENRGGRVREREALGDEIYPLAACPEIIQMDLPIGGMSRDH